MRFKENYLSGELSLIFCKQKTFGSLFFDEKHKKTKASENSEAFVFFEFEIIQLLRSIILKTYSTALDTNAGTFAL
ncbi:MAG: hypothetical protein RR141_01000 [Rikenellaceae bacterium]